jgi:nicotinic acid mononucleotide adenylyltransferase
MVHALNADGEKSCNVDFILEDYEYRNETDGGTPSVDSLPILKGKYPGAIIYFAQGQDSISSLFRRTWVRSNTLLDMLSGTYEIILFPRDIEQSESEIKISLDAELKSPIEKSRNGLYAPLEESARSTLLSRIHIVAAAFTSAASSSAIRKALREGGAAEELFHPAVYAKFLEFQSTLPDIYKSPACEPPPSASKGGSRKTVYKRKSTKRRHKKSKKNKNKSKDQGAQGRMKM